MELRCLKVIEMRITKSEEQTMPGKERGQSSSDGKQQVSSEIKFEFSINNTSRNTMQVSKYSNVGFVNVL